MKEITVEKLKELTINDLNNLKVKDFKDGKITKTIIEEKDKLTTITKIEPVEGKSTSSKISLTKNEITINS